MGWGLQEDEQDQLETATFRLGAWRSSPTAEWHPKVCQTCSNAPQLVAGGTWPCKNPSWGRTRGEEAGAGLAAGSHGTRRWERAAVPARRLHGHLRNVRRERTHGSSLRTQSLVFVPAGQEPRNACKHRGSLIAGILAFPSCARRQPLLGGAVVAFGDKAW